MRYFLRLIVSRCLATIGAVAVLLLSASAWAARPFVVDDARIVDQGACQVESWYKRNAASAEFWALPACNPFGLELSAGMGVLQHDGPNVHDERDYQFQVKGLFRELRANDFGWGLAAGVVRHADINLAPNLIGNYYAYVPVSRSLADDKVVLLGNVGVVNNRDADRRGLLWGGGGEFYVTPRIVLLGEIYGATGFDRFTQAGIRVWIVPDHVQLDSTYGAQLNGGDRIEWFTLGFRLISKRFY